MTLSLRGWGQIKAVAGAVAILSVSTQAPMSLADGPFMEVICPKTPENIPEITRAEVYAATPFRAGEKTTYELSWAGMKAGYADIEAKPPSKHEGIWHRIFSIDAKTGDWFRSVFYGKDQAMAYSRPSDFAVSKFYIEQYEEPVFKKPYVSKKWLDFNHKDCTVNEKTWDPAKGERVTKHAVSRGAIDALGAIFYLRTLTYKPGERRRALIYTSEKNWWLEADPVAFEKVKTPVGEFDAVKLKLRTYLGKVMQQKGDIFIWIATGTRERQLLQIQGEIKIGSVWARMINYQPGR
jgi:hypothetical protein